MKGVEGCIFDVRTDNKKRGVYANAEYINALSQLSRLRIVIVFIVYVCSVVFCLNLMHPNLTLA